MYDLTSIGRQIKQMFPRSQIAQGMSDEQVGQMWQRKYGKKGAAGSGAVNMSLLQDPQSPQMMPDNMSVGSSGLDLSGLNSLVEGGGQTNPSLNIAGLSGSTGLTGAGGVDFKVPQIQSATPQTTNLGNGVSALTYGSPVTPSSNVKPTTSLSQIDFNKKLFDGRGGLSR